MPITINSNAGNIYAGGGGSDGDIVLFTGSGDGTTLAQATMHLDGGAANMFAGGQGQDGDVVLRASDGATRVHLDAGSGNAWLGGGGADGDLVLMPSGGTNGTLEQATIHLDGGGANIFAGGQGQDGDIVLRAPDGADRIRLDAGGGNIWVGGNGADGDIVLFAASGDNATLAQATIHLNGDAGDIVLQNADCAEDFEIAEGENLEPGTVVALGDDSRLHASSEAYNRRVVGVIAGAGNLRPGIVLGRQRDGKRRMPVALVGRVFCKADASAGPIGVGDLLTTSDVPGHVMRAGDPGRAFGAVVGKAITGLKGGTGMVQVLVALQ